MRARNTMLQLCCVVLAGLRDVRCLRRRPLAQTSQPRRVSPPTASASRGSKTRMRSRTCRRPSATIFDKGLWEDTADLFTRSGSFEYGQSGVYIGQERIRRALLLFGPQGLAQGYLNNHMQLQAIITVAPDGKTATGRWQGTVQLAEPGANGIWGVGIYENEYVKEGGVWKIASAALLSRRRSPITTGGWARSLLPMKGPSALFPPDKPPTVVYRTMPGNYIPPFSFNHPVTGDSLKNLPQAADSVTGQTR